MKRLISLALILAMLLALMPLTAFAYSEYSYDYEINPNETIYVEIIEDEMTYIKFVPTVSGYYVFESISGDDTCAYLYDSEMYYLDSNDDGGSGGNFRIDYYFNAGETYYFGVYYYSWEGGSFDVVLSGPTDGLYYSLSYDETYYIVSEYYGSDTEVVIPSTYNGLPVKEIGASAFADCYNLTSIEIPDSVMWIGDSAFANCQSLTSINIPYSVTWIDFYAFDSCSGLETITVDSRNPVYHSAGNCIIETETRTLIQGCKNSVIPSDGSVTMIGDSAFYGCSSLTSINIPYYVTIIDEYAFGCCYNLTYVYLPSSVTTIGDYAFVDCYNLTSINIPSSVTTIGYKAFSGCDSIERNSCAEVWFSDTEMGEVNIYIPQGEWMYLCYKMYDLNTGLEYDTYFNNYYTVTLKIYGPDGSLEYSDVFDDDSAWIAVKRSVLGSYDGKLILESENGDSLTLDVTANVVQKTTITKQPVSVTAANGYNATVSVTATGDGLTYKWYYKNKGDSKFTLTNSFKGNSYSVEMNSTRAGRQVYCVITDKYGNSVTSNTVTLGMSNLKITKQPTNVAVQNGKTAKVTVTASGEGLTYKWYFKNKGDSKFTLTNSFKGNSYSIEMNSTRAGRQVYCVITDKYGATVKTNTVTLGMPVKITKQPTNVAVQSGKTAKVTVTASGDGLTYKWYYKNKGASKFSLTTSFTGNTYSVTMDSTRVGRQVYCVITDKYGNKVQTKTVTLGMAAKITTQPTSVKVANGKTAKVTVKASGEGLKYKWYYKDKGSSKFKLTTSFTGNSYSVTMTNARAGRQVYCVITDKYGNTVKTNTVTLNKK